MSDDIFIFSQNCQGLANMQKRRDLFHFVKSKKYNIICLQDIHLEKKMEPYIKSEWGYQVYMSPFRSNRRGVMILLNNNFEQQVESIKTDPNGNYIILNMTIQGKKVTLVNIYGPNEDNPQFYRNLKEKYSEFDNEILIICGDWNFVQNPEVDYYNYLHINNPRARKVVLDTMEENSLVDVWRLFNEDVRAYTWKRMNPVRKQERLDYFLINETCLEYVMDTNINPGYRTDHSSILLKLKFINNERGRGYWKFNNLYLKIKTT